MEKQKSTCKIDDLYGVEIGKYAIALEDGTVVSRQPEDSPYQFEIVPDDSGTVELSDSQIMLVQNINRQLTELDKLAEETGIPTSEYVSAPGEGED